ncbi:hypothetical protein QCA50_004957 [Cerrena zonata]|uniref:Uncharacterized protein n=1 Tax=Cerrena zonata TaxID=2478898 RepID=A0AAW0GDQ0_9APHY
MGGVVSVIGFMEIHKIMKKELELDSRQQLALWFICIIWTLTAVISLFGLLGCLFKIRGFVTSYAYTTTINTLANIAIGIFFVWTLFHRDNSKNGFLDKCDGGNGGEGEGAKVTHWFCQRGFDLIRVLIVVAFVIVWIFMLAGIFIVFDYVGQLYEEHELDKEEDEKRMRPQQPIIVAAEAAPVMRTTYDASPAIQGGWTSARSPYAFTMPDNSHGSNRV